MKGAKGKVGVILLVALMMGGVARAGKLPPAPKVDLPFFVYSDRGAAEAGYDFAPSGWMGNTDAIEYNDCADDPYFGDCCIEVIFDDRTGWGGIVWQNPAANWGDEEGGLDLTGATRLTFWARGKEGGERVEFSMGIIKKNKTFYDTTSVKLGKVKLDDTWKKYEIDLRGRDLSRIVTGFCFSVKGKKDPVTFYIDEIVYE